MIGLDPNSSAYLAVIWTINSKVLPHSEPNIGFDLSYFSFFIVNFVHLELCIPTSLAFLVSKMGLTFPLGQLVSKRKIVEEVVMKCKSCMFFSF